MKKYLILPVLLYFISPYLRYRSGSISSLAHHVKLPPAPVFEGNLQQNNNLERAAYFAKGKLIGPETVLFLNDTLYAGLANGQLVKLDGDGNIVDIIVQSGEKSVEECSKPQPANKECGLILGMRFKQPYTMYMADAYNGILKVNIFTKEKEYLLRTNDEVFADKPLIFANDLDLDEEGNIYFSQSSTQHTIEEGLDCIFDAAPTGRLFHYNEKTKELKVLVDQIRFANGVQLTPQKDAILVSELSMSRILKYNLRGPKAGELEVFLNVPGSPDNIRLTERGTLIVPLVFARSADITRTTMLELLGEYPLFRSIISKFVNVPKVMLALPKYALIVEYSLEDKHVIKSWHDPTGKVIDFATCVTLHNDKLYIGSFYLDHISVVDY